MASIGQPIDRIDGRLKVTGQAKYAAEFAVPDAVHAMLVQSTIGAGVITGFDIDGAKVDRLNAGESYIHRIDPQQIRGAQAKGFRATADFSEVANVDAILICVPTPLSDHHTPDMSYITATMDSIVDHLRPGQLVVLESTTYPGTTQSLLLPILEESGLKAGVDFFLAFAPEREDPGNAEFGTRNIPKVVGGINTASRDLTVALYEKVMAKVVRVSML